MDGIDGESRLNGELPEGWTYHPTLGRVPTNVEAPQTEEADSGDLPPGWVYSPFSQGMAANDYQNAPTEEEGRPEPPLAPQFETHKIDPNAEEFEFRSPAETDELPNRTPTGIEIPGDKASFEPEQGVSHHMPFGHELDDAPQPPDDGTGPNYDLVLLTDFC
ncbi:hypothetical protein [Jannaschia sp. LMIT008]|uniref:hypothetical protein n=1 Tax=Jannaschia maritima TaxID=3032585 RepID=UPI002811ADFC|nr:hypothetical protein [Jannaschia sp. LMIT008]